MRKEEQVIKGSRDLLNKLVWLNKLKMENILKDYKSSEVHCIEYIGDNEDSNVTKLAEAFYMTRGAISKLTKKLIKKNILESYKKSDNKKELYFRLTEKGTCVKKVHEELHEEFRKRDRAVFDGVPDEQFDIMLNFIEKYSVHLDKEIKKLNLKVTNKDDFE